MWSAFTLLDLGKFSVLAARPAPGTPPCLAPADPPHPVRTRQPGGCPCPLPVCSQPWATSWWSEGCLSKQWTRQDKVGGPPQSTIYLLLLKGPHAPHSPSRVWSGHHPPILGGPHPGSQLPEESVSQRLPVQSCSCVSSHPRIGTQGT